MLSVNEILQSSNVFFLFCTDTNIWMLHLDSNEKYGAKARKKLLKNTKRGFKQIKDAAPHKTAAIRPLTSHLTNHLCKMKKT